MVQDDSPIELADESIGLFILALAATVLGGNDNARTFPSGEAFLQALEDRLYRLLQDACDSNLQIPDERVRRALKELHTLKYLCQNDDLSTLH